MQRATRVAPRSSRLPNLGRHREAPGSRSSPLCRDSFTPSTHLPQPANHMPVSAFAANHDTKDRRLLWSSTTSRKSTPNSTSWLGHCHGPGHVVRTSHVIRTGHVILQLPRYAVARWNSLALRPSRAWCAGSTGNYSSSRLCTARITGQSFVSYALCKYQAT